MANTRVALAKGFSVAVVVVVLLVGGYVLFLGGFSEGGALAYLLTLSFALTGARGIWNNQYKVATVGTVGMLVAAALQSPFVVGLAVLQAVALVLGWSGRTREQMESE